MQWDFTDVAETEDFASLPQGWYTVQIEEVREGRTRDGGERWGLKLVVGDGRYAGRVAAWDGIVWTERGSPRAKRLLEALGFEVTGTIQLEPKDLLGRSLDVELVLEEWENPVTGHRQRRNRVSYNGFAPEGSAVDRMRAEAEGLPMVVSEAGESVDAWGGDGESCAHEPALSRSEIRSS